MYGPGFCTGRKLELVHGEATVMKSIVTFYKIMFNYIVRGSKSNS